MGAYDKIYSYIIHPRRFLLRYFGKHFAKMSDESFIKYRFIDNFGYPLNLENPQTFNEKLQWLKLNDHNERYIKLVDKAAVKDIIGKEIGYEHIIPTLHTYTSVDKIEFDKLPDSFVIKCTHDSGGIYLCKDKSKANINEINNIIGNSLKRDYYLLGREWPYKFVSHQIIIEPYMIDLKTGELRDYKFFCFNGVVKCFKIDFNRFTNHRANYYSTDCKLLDIGETVCPPDPGMKIEFPSRLEEMIHYAEILSKGIPFVRVDFYEINDCVYFGEMTFYPASGFGTFTNFEADKRMGEWLIL